jgi:hypothetical protein
VGPNEKVQFRGRYICLTTEEKEGHLFERVYSRNGISIFVIPSPGVLRFIRGTSWKNPSRGPMVLSAYLEDSEDALTCAKRELLEELGATAATWEHFMTSSWKGTVVKTQEFFVAKDITQGIAKPDSDEDIDGYIDLSHEEVKRALLQLTFGSNENAFALFKFISERD